MSKYNVGDIYAIYEGTKRRSVVIINDGLGIDVDLSVTRITSKNVRNTFDVALKHWQVAGLNKPSVVRCSKITTIKPGRQLIKIGTLHEEDLYLVEEKILEYFSRGFKRAQQEVN